MTVEEQVVAKLRSLTPQKQEEVLAFVNDLQKSPGEAEESLMGLFAHLNIKITDNEIAEARREMWGSFPREVS